MRLRLLTLGLVTISTLAFADPPLGPPPGGYKVPPIGDGKKPPFIDVSKLDIETRVALLSQSIATLTTRAKEQAATIKAQDGKIAALQAQVDKGKQDLANLATQLASTSGEVPPHFHEYSVPLLSQAQVVSSCSGGADTPVSCFPGNASWQTGVQTLKTSPPK